VVIRELDAPLEDLRPKGVTAKALRDTVAALKRMGIDSAGDLLRHYPRGYEDRATPRPFKDFQQGPVCTTARVLAHDHGVTRKGIPFLKTYVEDDTARAALTQFYWNRAWALDPPGTVYRIYGRFDYYGGIQSSNFTKEKTSARDGEFGAVLPIYPLSGALTQKPLRRLIRAALDHYADSLDEELPDRVIQRDGLLHKAAALRAVHFPQSLDEANLARRTIIYEELFQLELLVARRALARRGAGGSERA